ncbi:MAG TPA: AAA family ATPase [Bacteroidales bacterium]|nr:AAA family ATPase [Bacteroidales bacterium]
MKRVSDAEYEKKNIFGHYLLELSIENLRCYGDKQTMKFSDTNGKPYHWTIILGDNGSGKTCLLKSIVSVAPSPKKITGQYQDIRLYPGLFDWKEQWNPQRHDGEKPTHISAEITGGYGFDNLLPDTRQTLEIIQDHKKYADDITANNEEYGKLGDFLCFAYGATRKMGHVSLSDNKYYSMASLSLFDDEAPLINVEEFFLKADYEAKTAKSKQSIAQRDRIKKILIGILPEVEDIRIKKGIDINRNVVLLTKFGWVRINNMSLGYKSLIAWVVDFSSRMFYYHHTKADPLAQPAVVLIDEIDLHLHPIWQRNIISCLSEQFPNTQFIATAHSPLIVQAALDANLILLKRNNDQVEVAGNPEIIKNWRIDQILTSDLFGISGVRSVQTEILLQKRRDLLLKKNLSAADKKMLEALEDEIGFLPVAETHEYIKAMQLIEKAAGKLNK